MDWGFCIKLGAIIRPFVKVISSRIESEMNATVL